MAGTAATHEVRSRDGTRIAFERRGEDGPHLVVVAGALSDRSSAGPLAEHLARSLTVLTYDRRGRGDSGDTPPYAVEREIEDLIAVAAESTEPPFVYGHSSGGVLALRASAAGMPASRIVVYEPPFILEGTREPLPLDLDGRLMSLLTEQGPDAAVRAFLREGPQIPDIAIDAMVASPAWEGLRALGHTTPHDAAIMGDGRIPEEVRRIRTPVLVLQGGASPDWQLAGTQALAEMLPAGRLVRLEGLDHAGARADPERVAGEVTRFLLDGPSR